MEASDKQKKGFVGYEYKEISVDKSNVSFMIDCYENFGWELDENIQMNTQPAYGVPSKKMTVRMKRNRKLVNKMELTRLQRNFEACVSEIQALEKAKTSTASIYAITTGILGTAFMAGSTFAAPYYPVHHTCGSGIYRLDPSLFSVQEDSEKADKKTYTFDRRKI